MVKVLENIKKVILYIVVGLFPLFFLNNFLSPFILGKAIILVVGVFIISLLNIFTTIARGSIKAGIGRFDIVVLLITLAYSASTLLATPNKAEAYLLPGTTTFIVAGAILYFLINQFDHKTKENVSIILFMSALLVAVVSLLAPLGILASIPQLSLLAKDLSFNPMGSAISSITFISFVIFFSLKILIKEKSAIRKFFYGTSLIFLVFALVIQLTPFITQRADSPRFVSAKDSWEITIDSIKKKPLLGMGPGNYLTAFNLFRPLTYNQSDLWTVRFSNASNYYLTAISETGIVGFVAIIVLFAALFKNIRQTKFNFNNIDLILEYASLLTLLLLFGLLPQAPYMIVFLFIGLALFSKSENKPTNLIVPSVEGGSWASSRISLIIITLPIAGVIAWSLFLITPILAAENSFKKSMDALGKNDAKSTYNLMNTAINKNPRVDRYHASFAQVNMTLAMTLASKEDIGDADRATITQLTQQAISEAKATVALNPTRSANWEVLAGVYKNIAPFAQGANQFALQTYQEAIALDPINPNLRIALGSIYYSMGEFDTAIDLFKLAILAKPDLPNAHYNLALAYKEKGSYELAIQEMEAVVKLIKKDTNDYKLANQVLNDLKSKKSAETTVIEIPESLTEPEEDVKNNINPPIDLPEEATPPASAN